MSAESFNPFSWAVNALSSPSSGSNKKRKMNDDIAGDDNADLTLESIAGQIKELKKSNERIENLLKSLLKGNDDGDDDAESKDEEEVVEKDDGNGDEEGDAEEILSPQWMAKFEELKAYKAKHGNTRIAKGTHQELGRWIVRQRSENKTGKMRQRDAKVAKLNTVDFDWAPQAATPSKPK